MIITIAVHPDQTDLSRPMVFAAAAIGDDQDITILEPDHEVVKRYVLLSELSSPTPPGVPAKHAPELAALLSKGVFLALADLCYANAVSGLFLRTSHTTPLKE